MFYAMTSENFRDCDYYVVGTGSTKDEALIEAQQYIDSFPARTFRHDTLARNLICVSRSEALRKGYISRRAYVVLDGHEIDGLPPHYHIEY